jgi:hypothetical protein
MRRRPVRRADAAGLGLALLLAAAAATALPPALRDRLPQLPAATQRMLLARDAQWQAMTPAQQQAFRQRLAAWDALPTSVRRERRESWLAWNALPADQRVQVRAAALAFAALDVAQQQALRAQFAQQDATQRHGWLLGPALGADFAALQPLLMQVPAIERKPLLDALRALTPSERIDLGMLAQRTPPQQRDALRRALLSTADGNRASWLQSELAR